MPWRFAGSATAMRRTPSAAAYGIAPMRSRTWSGISFAACSSTLMSARSTSGSWCRAASIRAMPSLEATPSSTSAEASERVCCARPRASASRSSGTSFVAASRSTTSSTDSLTPNGVDSGSPPATPVSGPLRSDGMGLSFSLTWWGW